MSGLREVPEKDLLGFECEACIHGKGTRLPSPPSSVHAQEPLALVHLDLWGPSSTPSHNGSRYFLTCYDDYTRKVHLYFLKAKSEAFHKTQHYIAMVERQLGRQVKVIIPSLNRRGDARGLSRVIEWMILYQNMQKGNRGVSRGMFYGRLKFMGRWTENNRISDVRRTMVT